MNQDDRISIEALIFITGVCLIVTIWSLTR